MNLFIYILIDHLELQSQAGATQASSEFSLHSIASDCHLSI
jgi:hypothetical protein